MAPIRIPLACSADAALARLARATGSRAIAALDGMTLLGERAMLGGFAIPGSVSAGGGCGLYRTLDGTIALNLARPADRELLPALFESEEFDTGDAGLIAERTAIREADWLIDRGRLFGLAIAGENERLPSPLRPCTELVAGQPVSPGSRPRVLDLSALWAGPLAAHLLWLAGAEVVKVESRRRPDAMRDGDEAFYQLLNQDKASVALDFTDTQDRQALLQLIAASDIVIEAARPRALAQFGIDAEAIVRGTPGLVWITITGHGATGEAAHWVGFGDDCGVTGGLTAALRAASGRAGFVGDAIADPLTGLAAASQAWDAWSSGRGGRFALAMSHVVAACLEEERAARPCALERELSAWAGSAGEPFPEVQRRPIGALAELGADTRSLPAPVA
jgi:CoA transferase family III